MIRHGGLILCLLISTIFIFLFYLSSIGSLGFLFLFVIIVLTLFSSLNVKGKNNTSISRVSIYKFLLIPVILTSIVLSKGYLYRYTPSMAPLSGIGTVTVSFTLVFIELAVVISMAEDASGRMKSFLLPNGYLGMEIDSEMYIFKKSVISMAVLSTVSGAGFILLITSAPSLDIGFIPAVVLFFIVFILIIAFALKKES